MFKWFDTTEVDNFTTSLVNEFMQRVPRDSLEKEVRGAQARQKDAVDALLNRVARFASGRRLNVFKRARLANSLKWALQEAGYNREMVEELALAVAKKVTTTRYVGQAGTAGNKKS